MLFQVYCYLCWSLIVNFSGSLAWKQLHCFMISKSVSSWIYEHCRWFWLLICFDFDVLLELIYGAFGVLLSGDLVIGGSMKNQQVIVIFDFISQLFWNGVMLGLGLDMEVWEQLVVFLSEWSCEMVLICRHLLLKYCSSTCKD